MMTETRQVLDVSDLPDGSLDHRSPIWWGNLMLLFIETTMFGILVACYFYCRLNFSPWPPTQPNFFPPNFRPVPDMGVPLANLAVILLSCAPMAVADWAALNNKTRPALLGILGCIALALVAIVLRSFEFHVFKFKWDDNAYGSLVWMITGLHLTHLIVGTCENLIMTAWIVVHGMDQKHARDVRVTAVYWYWIAAIWVLLFGVLYITPRI